MANFNSLGRLMLSIIGLLFSFYALHVEITKLHNKEYKAMCDINENISCSKVFTSKYGTGFGLIAPVLGEDSVFNVPNTIYGMIFYLLTITLGMVKNNPTAAKVLFITSLVSCIGCVYLAYILYFVLHDFCVICVSTYAVNAFLLYLNWSNLKAISKEKRA